MVSAWRGGVLKGEYERGVIHAQYKGRSLFMKGVRAGRDLNITLSGGDIPHIGAVAVSSIGPALHQPERLTCTDSMIGLSGHKEAELARQVASRLASQLQCTVAVACGIHFNQATAEEISGILKVVDSMVERFLQFPLVDASAKNEATGEQAQ